MRSQATSGLASILITLLLLLTMPGATFFPAGAQPKDGTQSLVPIKLNFDNGANGELVPTPVAKDPVEQISMLGKPPGTVITGLVVGTWKTKQVKFPLSIAGPFGCTLWADSQKGAKNAYFTVDIYKGSTLLVHLNTSRQNLGDKPVRYDISATLTVDLAAGDTLTVYIYFFSDLVVNPGTILPQPAQATFFYGGGEYSSGITITTVPMVVSIPEPGVEDGVDFITFSAKVKEAFGADPSKMNYTMTITPPAGAKIKNYGKVTPQETTDGITFSLIWNYTKDDAKDGYYTIKMDASYDGNTTFTNTSKYYISIPRKAVTGFENTPLQPLILGSAAIGVLFLGVAVYYNRKKIMKKFFGKTTKTKPKKAQDDED